jgi:hypothetical protein
MNSSLAGNQFAMEELILPKNRAKSKSCRKRVSFKVCCCIAAESNVEGAAECMKLVFDYNDHKTFYHVIVTILRGSP